MILSQSHVKNSMRSGFCDGSGILGIYYSTTEHYDSEKHQIKTILLVGAPPWPDEQIISPDDTEVLSAATAVAVSLGMQLYPQTDRPAPEVKAIDIESHHLEETGENWDFLTGKFKADMVVTFDIFNRSGCSAWEKAEAIRNSMPAFATEGTKQSRLHYTPNVWHDAAVRAGVKVVVCQGPELRANTFVGEHFSQVHLPVEVNKWVYGPFSVACTDDFAAAHGLELKPKPSNASESSPSPNQR